MLFLLVPITLALLTPVVYDAADGVVPVSETEAEKFNPMIQAGPAGPKGNGESNQ